MISTDSQQPVYTTLSVPGHSITINRTISRNNGTDIELPEAIRMQPGDGKQNKTVIVRASDIVSVYVFENNWCCGDAFQSIPSSQLGTDYQVSSYQPHSPYYPSLVCVSALHHSTTITISNSNGFMHEVLLQPFQSYQYDGLGLEDLSGMLVQSDQPVAVISGSYSLIPETASYAGGIMSQLLPMKSWGTLYYIFPFESLNSGFVYRVFSSNILTRLRFYNGRVEYIQPGNFYEGDVIGDTAVSFEADNCVMVAQYMKSWDANNPVRGAPSMLVVSPVTSYSHDVTFSVLLYEHWIGHDYYINVVIECELINGLHYDGTRISVASSPASTWSRISAADQTMCCVRSSVSTGYHSITHVNPVARFSVSVYAIYYDRSSSYAYTVRGASTTGKL